jgi:hypothetical protein
LLSPCTELRLSRHDVARNNDCLIYKQVPFIWISNYTCSVITCLESFTTGRGYLQFLALSIQSAILHQVREKPPSHLL